MANLFHITSKVNVSNIMLKGLIPGYPGINRIRGNSVYLHKDGRLHENHGNKHPIRPIYMCDTISTIESFLSKQKIQQYEFQILKINVDGLYIKKLHDNEYVCNDLIEPFRIKLIGNYD